MRKLTQSEAIGLLDIMFNVSPEDENSPTIEAFIAGVRDDEAQTDVNSFISIMPDAIDADSITIRPDTIDGSDLDCTHIKIIVEG